MKAGEQMINFPTNVHPHNNAIVIEKEQQSNGHYVHMNDFYFTYTGGFSLGRVEMNLFDMNTETQLLSRSQVYTQLGGSYSKAYSGDKIEFTNTNNISSVCDNGHNYAYNLILFQYDFNDNPVYDMFLFKGKIDVVLESTTQIQFETEIENLYAGYAVMYIGNEYRLITNYNSSTGIATIESAFSNALTVDTTFKVYCNYVKSQNYFFKARSLPTVSANLSREYGQVKASINYSQPENIPLKYWQYSLWQTDNLSKWVNGRTPADYTEYEDIIDTRHYYIGTGFENIVNKTIWFDVSMTIALDDDTTYVTTETSKKPMNNKIIAYNSSTGIATMAVTSLPVSRYIPKPSTRFTIRDNKIPFISKSAPHYTNNTNYRFNIDASGHSYRLKYDVVTQDNVFVSGTADVTYNEATETLINQITKTYLQNDSNSIVIEWDSNGDWKYQVPCLIFRKDEDDSVFKIIGTAIHSDACFIDYSVANSKKYQYMIMPCNYSNKNSYYKTVSSEIVSVDFNGWMITAISPITDSKYTETYNFKQYKEVLSSDVKLYSVGDTWKLEGDIENPTISQNLNKVMQIGLSKYPTIIKNNNNYLSGKFSGCLGYFDCSIDDWYDSIYLVEKWRKFMADNTQFMIRNNKGDVMCVEISATSAPDTTYDESTKQLITTVQFDYVEFDNVDNLIFFNLNNDSSFGNSYEEEVDV